MNKRIITISAFCIITIVSMVRSGLAQESIYLPIVINDDADTTIEATTTVTTVAATSTPIPIPVATDTSSGGVDPLLFFDGAFAEEATVVDCTLSDGTETMCYEITIAGVPANHDIGPFCPETTAAVAKDVGIWFDGNGIYDVDGEFILGLAELYNDSNWKLYNDDGIVKITDTEEAFDAAARPDVDPAYQNHCVAGKMEWLDNGEPVQTTVTIPINPVPAENSSTGGNWGVTLNGVIIAASAPVDAILSAYAMDGYPVHSALSDEDAADLDECNGHTTDGLGYHYHANPAEENSVLTCFKGLMVAGDDAAGGGPPDGGPPGGGPPSSSALNR